MQGKRTLIRLRVGAISHSSRGSYTITVWIFLCSEPRYKASKLFSSKAFNLTLFLDSTLIYFQDPFLGAGFVSTVRFDAGLAVPFLRTPCESQCRALRVPTWSDAAVPDQFLSTVADWRCGLTTCSSIYCVRIYLQMFGTDVLWFFFASMFQSHTIVLT